MLVALAWVVMSFLGSLPFYFSGEIPVSYTHLAIATSDSMEARGYGLKGRTSFHTFRFTRQDGALLG